MPVEDFLLKGADAEAGVAAEVERAEASKDGGAWEEEGELAEDVDVEDVAFAWEERLEREFGASWGGRLLWLLWAGWVRLSSSREVDIFAEEEVLEEWIDAVEQIRE